MKEDNPNQANKASLLHLKTLLKEFIKSRPEIEKTNAQIGLFKYILESQSNSDHNPKDIKELLNVYPKNILDDSIKEKYLKEELQNLAQSGLIIYHDIPEISNKVWLNPTSLVEYVHTKILNKKLVSNGIVVRSKFEEGKSLEIIALLKVQKVIFYDKDSDKYIIPNYLPLLDEDNAHDYFIFKDFQQVDLVLKFQNFIPFGYINRLICYFGRNPDKKIFKRNHLVFTLNKEVKIMIHLDFERLKIEVAVKPKDNYQLPKNFLRGFMYELIALYHGEGLKMKPSFKNKKVLSYFFEGGVFDSSKRPKMKFTDLELNSNYYSDYKYLNHEFEIPEDLFISLNNKDYVQLIELEDEEEISHQIRVFQEESNVLVQKYSTSTTNYKSISFNKNLNSMKKIFISYSRQDVTYRDELRKHLNFAKLFGIVDHWACEDIQIGNWHEQIQSQLEEADLIIMMLSINFFNSRYILEHEILKTIRLIEAGKQIKVYPIIVSEFPNISLNSIDSQDAHIVEAINKVSEHQWGMYDTITNIHDEKSERIYTLKEFYMKNRLDWALAKIVEKIVKDIQDTKNK